MSASTPPIKWRVPKWAAIRAQVFTRDGFTCRVCGWRTPEIPENYDGRYAPRGLIKDGDGKVRILEVDHIYPRFLGGTSDIANLQTLCNRCNASKSVRT